MEKGLLIYNRGSTRLFLPVFSSDRELVFSVLSEAMRTCEISEQEFYGIYSHDFFNIAESLGRKRMNSSHSFIGPEDVIGLWFDTVEEAYNKAGYIFEPDFKERKINLLK
jgi:hypothetical protein